MRSLGRLSAALLVGCGFLSSLCSSVAEEITEEDSVLVLDDKNFEGAIRANPFILVEFYAPWCGHCKQFAPEYAAAAQVLKRASPPIPLAKVDATAHYKLAEEHGVRGYPTIRLFIDGKDQEYTGGRTEQSIVTWVTKKTGPPIVPLADMGAAEAFDRDNKMGVVAFLPDASTGRAALETAARQQEDIMFAYTTSAEVAGKYGMQSVGLKMFFPHDEKSAQYDGDLQNAEEVERFVKAYRHPLITPFNGETAPELFGDGRTILFLFRDNNDEGKAAEEELRKAAPTVGRRLLISISGSSEPMDQRLMDYVSVEPAELPTVKLVASPMASMVKYRLEGGAVTQGNIVEFVKSYEAGRLKPHMKSEDAPTSQTGPVVQVVGSTFDSIVRDPTKDVLVEFYAPWCGHCKKLEPVYREVAKRVEHIPTLTIAKIDATQNDVEGIDVEGFPTIKFWRADKKEDPMDYDGERDVDAFLAWLEERATHNFRKTEL